MNFRNYFVAVWQGIVGKPELKQANEAGQRDGQALGLSYVQGVQQGVDDALTSSLPLLIGSEVEAEEVLAEAEIVAKTVDFSKMSKRQLRRYADQNEIEVDGRWSEETLREEITELGRGEE